MALWQVYELIVQGYDNIGGDKDLSFFGIPASARLRH